jgi:hypothetical protein
MKRHVAKLSAALALALVATAAQAASPDPQHRGCFPAGTAWQGWSVAGQGDVLYLRVYLNDIYRVDLTPGSRVYRSASDFLVNEVRGSGWICSALDLDLMLSDNLGFRRPLIAVAMRKLTPEEVAAIPRKELP